MKRILFLTLLLASSVFPIERAHSSIIPCGGGVCTVTTSLDPFAGLSGSATVVVGGNAPGIVDDGFGFKAKTPGGLQTWSFNGVDLMFTQSSWFRLGGQTKEISPDSIEFPGSANSTATQDDELNRIVFTYSDQSSISIESVYRAIGPILDKTITISNNTLAPIDLTWFEYFDLDLDSSGLDESVDGGRSFGETATQQSNPNVTDNIPGVPSNTNVIIRANEEVDFALDVFTGRLVELGGRANLLDLFMDNLPTSFAGSPDRQFLDVGLEDYIFALQFDRVLLPGMSTVVDISMFLDTPFSASEPGTLELLIVSIAGLGFMSWWRRATTS